ncbi:hypothetical protein ACFQJC_08990 [Haloferax namakaokahaiae]|uniref:Uncharacterized protein n=1 Tax=Haloferax namakaokahaiae TaxID=1748331 RepID=A0ABD5ZED2_9EURY
MPRRSRLSVLLVALVVLAGVVYLTNGVATQRAIEHEEAYLNSQLSNATCLTSYGTTETTSRTRASVVGYGLTSRTVRVQHAYWFSTGELDADGSSEATYEVTIDSVRRVGGDSVTPC